MSLQPRDFGAFHLAVHGREPFAWQQRLLEQVVRDRRWPAVLDLPTGAGKTTCLDIALFALALDATSTTPWCARRIAMVVDRRVVVDQVAERGRTLALAVSARNPPTVIAEVASRLRSLSHEQMPLAVYTLRGGMPKDDGWARTPDQPLILASTVDQLGSRLLMQGYGVSAGMAPVHAGLLGNDTLVLLDEVHLSAPFAETLDQLQVLRTRFSASPATRFQCTFLSATPLQQPGTPFSLTDEDTAEGTVLGTRLRTKKPARLVEVDGRTELEARCVTLGRELVDKHRTLAVVVNRVASAITVARQLRETLGTQVEVRVMTGRMRPLDRDRLLDGVRSRIVAGRKRRADDTPLIVVATQCIEAGADFDFDALVSEAASLPALRQRFGRVDRLGEYGKAEGVIVYDRASAKDDPVYGGAIASTYSWLKVHLEKKSRAIDFGPLQLPTPVEDERIGLQGPSKRAPVLLPAYLDLWAQTKPAPALVPEVSLFLHGPESGPADVQIVWRVDLDKNDFDEERVTEIVSAVRPSSLEAVSVPFAAARRWLASQEASEIADVEGAATNDTLQAAPTRVFRWAGDASKFVPINELRPGDTVIVPASRGGLWEGCFDPAARAEVVDLAEQAAMLARGRALLRLHPRVLRQLGLTSVLDAGGDLQRETLEAQAADSANATNRWMRPWSERLLRRGKSFVVVPGENGWPCLDGGVVARAEFAALGVDPESDVTSEEEESSFVGRAVSLAEHSKDVETFAKEFATALRLPEALSADLTLAGWLHDIGKADARFQLLLRRGDEIEFFKDETPWAKSGMAGGARYEQRLAAKKSKYPQGARHEVQSLAMLEAHRQELSRRAHDVDLVLHLVASHHGHCRPFAPPISDSQPVEVSLQHGDWVFGPVTSNNQLHRLDSPIADRFWKLIEKYGWLELCWLEAIVRLADHRASELEHEGAG